MGTSKTQRRTKIKKRIRSLISGDKNTPRLTVFRSNKQIYAQLIDDVSGTTLASAGSLKEKSSSNKTEQAKNIGKQIADKAIKAGIKKVRFDRNGYLYHGRVKSLAEAAREAGLEF